MALSSWLLLLLLAQAPDGGAPGEPASTPVHRRTWEVMHTRVTVALVDEREASAHAEAFAETLAIFTRIDEVMNEWRPDSPLSRINRAAGGEPVQAPRDLCEVIQLSLEGARRTRGLFDPTWAALREVWRFGSDQTGEPPSPEAVRKACRLVSWRDVEVRPLEAPTPQAACTVRLKRKGMQLGLGGLVKGWGVDQAVKKLRARGYRNFFVQAGGDLYLAGRNGARPWQVGIRDPRGPPESSFARAELSDVAFSTSGDYEHFFLEDGRRYHHLIDLRTCWPATASVSATVMARSAVEAEFLTKATFVLGPGEGQKLAASFGASVVLVDPAGRVHLSPELEGRLVHWPTSLSQEGEARGKPDSPPPPPGKR